MVRNHHDHGLPVKSKLPKPRQKPAGLVVHMGYTPVVHIHEVFPQRRIRGRSGVPGIPVVRRPPAPNMVSKGAGGS